MVIANMLVRAGKGIVLEKAVSELSRVYSGFAGSRRNHEESINAYKLHDNKYFSGGTLRDISKRYGLEGMIGDYNNSLIDRMHSYLKEIHEVTQYLRDVAQKKIPATDATVYERVSTAYIKIAGLTGIKIPKSNGNYNYLSDIANEYLHQIGNINSRLEKFLRLASAFDTRRSAARRAAKYLAGKVLESKGIPIHSIDLVVSSISRPFAEIEKKAKPLFADYNDVVSQFRNAYGSDLSANGSPYARLAA